MRKNSFDSKDTQNYVVHTQIYRSRHKSGSSSGSSSRRNSQELIDIKNIFGHTQGATSYDKERQPEHLENTNFASTNDSLIDEYMERSTHNKTHKTRSLRINEDQISDSFSQYDNVHEAYVNNQYALSSGKREFKRDSDLKAFQINYKENKEIPKNPVGIYVESICNVDYETLYSGISYLTIPRLKTLPGKLIRTYSTSHGKQRSYSLDLSTRHLHEMTCKSDYDLPNLNSLDQIEKNEFRQRHRSRRNRRSKEFVSSLEDSKANGLECNSLLERNTQQNYMYHNKAKSSSVLQVEVQERFPEIKDKTMPINSENHDILNTNQYCSSNDCNKIHGNSSQVDASQHKQATDNLLKRNIYQNRSTEIKGLKASIPKSKGIESHIYSKYSLASVPYTYNENCISEKNKFESKQFTPRVLRPRRRRSKSQDLGIGNTTETFSLQNVNSLKHCRSLDDVAEVCNTKKKLQDNLDYRFQELLDTYLFGTDGSYTRGKVVRRKLKGYIK